MPNIVIDHIEVVELPEGKFFVHGEKRWKTMRASVLWDTYGRPDRILNVENDEYENTRKIPFNKARLPLVLAYEDPKPEGSGPSPKSKKKKER